MREAYAWSWRDEILKCIYDGCCTCHSKRKLHVKKPTLIRWSLKPSEPRPRKNNTENVRGDSGRHFLLRVLYNAVWWAQSYSPDPPLPPPPIHSSSVFSLPAKTKSFWEPSEQHHSKNRMHRQSGASERRFLLRVYNHRESTRRCVVDTIVLPRPSTTTTTYPHSIIIFLSAWFHHQTTHNIYICVYSKCHRLCTVHDGTWNSPFSMIGCSCCLWNAW